MNRKKTWELQVYFTGVGVVVFLVSECQCITDAFSICSGRLDFFCRAYFFTASAREKTDRNKKAEES